MRGVVVMKPRLELCNYDIHITLSQARVTHELDKENQALIYRDIRDCSTLQKCPCRF